jgi:hypothetical protein
VHLNVHYFQQVGIKIYSLHRYRGELAPVELGFNAQRSFFTPLKQAHEKIDYDINPTFWLCNISIIKTVKGQ